MANSKSSTPDNDPKPKKIVDVALPGKSAPSNTSRPIIVSNRPMLKRDPMVSPTGDNSADSGEPISRVAKPIQVTTFEANSAIEAKPQENAVAPPSSESMPLLTPIKPSSLKIVRPIVDEAVTKETAPEGITASEDKKRTATPISVRHDDNSVLLEVGEEAIAASESSDGAITANAVRDETFISGIESNAKPVKGANPVSSSEAVPITVSKKTSEANPPATPTLPKQLDSVVSSISPLAPPKTTDQQETPTVAPIIDVPATTVSDTATEINNTQEITTGAIPEASDGISETDEQLAPNKAIEDAKRKQAEAEAAKAAELEKIIASKQYYLPINASKNKRGSDLAVVVLVLILLLTLVWADVVLDAGIIRIPGIHPLTHFFR